MSKNSLYLMIFINRANLLHQYYSVMENFFGIMKSELLYAKEYTSMDCFITDFISVPLKSGRS